MSCPSCPETSAFVARTCLEWRCDCGKLHRPDSELVKRASDGVREPEWALNNLEKWISFIEGQSGRLDSIWEVPRNARGKKERQKPIVMPTSQIEKIVSGSGGIGHQTLSASHDAMDTDRIERFVTDHFEEISKAVIAVRRIEWMLSRPDQVRHAVVLLLVYLMTGSDTRSQWRKDGGVGTWIGYLCTRREYRETWLTSDNPDQAAFEARIFGDKLLRDARGAWRDLPSEADRAVINRGRLRLSEARERLQRVIAETYEDIRAAEQLRDNGALNVA